MKFYSNLKLLINYYSMRYLKRQDIPMYYVYIPYWKFRNMPFLCIMYTILKFQRQEDCEIYQNSLNSRRGHKNMTFPRAPFNYHMEIHVCEKITRNTLSPKVLGISGAPTKQQISKEDWNCICISRGWGVLDPQQRMHRYKITNYRPKCWIQNLGWHSSIHKNI